MTMFNCLTVLCVLVYGASSPPGDHPTPSGVAAVLTVRASIFLYGSSVVECYKYSLYQAYYPLNTHDFCTCILLVYNVRIIIIISTSEMWDGLWMCKRSARDFISGGYFLTILILANCYILYDYTQIVIRVVAGRLTSGGGA